MSRDQHLRFDWLAFILALTICGVARAQTVVSYPDPDRIVFTRLNAPLCPSYPALTQFMQRAYAHDTNASLFDFGCFPAAVNWPGQILKEHAGLDLWAEVRIVMPSGVPQTFWTIAWELQNGAPVAQLAPTSRPPHHSRGGADTV